MIRTSRVAYTGTLLLALVAAVSWAIATRGSRRVPMTREVAREMRAGGEFAKRLEHSLTITPAESISVSDAVAAAISSGLRLGLGSPFRLIDYALADPYADRIRFAIWSLMRCCSARSMGDAYHAPPAALSLAGASMSQLPLSLAARHVALIDSVVASAFDPRGGELTVREAYRLAAPPDRSADEVRGLVLRWRRLPAIARSPAPTWFAFWPRRGATGWIRSA